MRVRVGFVVFSCLLTTAAYAGPWESDGRDGISPADMAPAGSRWHPEGSGHMAGPHGSPAYFRTIAVCEASQASRIANIASGRFANVVVAATFDGVAHAGRFTLASRGETDILLAQYDPRGRVLWARSFGDSQRQRVADVATDPAGNIYLLGDFSGVLDFGRGVSLHPTEMSVGFVAKLDAQGRPLWALQLGSAGPVYAEKLAIDPQGRIALTGAFEGRIQVLGYPVLGDGNFVAQVDGDGRTLWVTSVRGADDGIQAVALDRAQNTSVWLAHAHADRSQLRRLDPFGGLILDRRYMGKMSGDIVEDPQGMVADAAGNLFLVGQGYLDHAGDLAKGGDFLAKLNPLGDVLWIDRFSDRELKRLAMTPMGNIRVAGLGPVRFGEAVRSLVVATYDPWGHQIWTRQLGDVQSIDGFDLDPLGATLLAGTSHTGSSNQLGTPADGTTEQPGMDDQGSQGAPAEHAGRSPCGAGNELQFFVAKLAP
jgi:hypothetical protein